MICDDCNKVSNHSQNSPLTISLLNFKISLKSHFFVFPIFLFPLICFDHKGLYEQEVVVNKFKWLKFWLDNFYKLFLVRMG